MAFSYTRNEIGKGIYLTEIYDGKFKSDMVRFNFVTPYDEKRSYANALLQILLITSNSEIKSRTELACKMSELYGSSIRASYGSVGDFQTCGLSANFICDKYTIDGENISSEVVRQLLLCLFSPDISDGKFNENYFKIRKQELVDNIAANINDKRTYAMLQARKIIFEGEPAGFYDTVEGAESVTQQDLLEAFDFLRKEAVIEITVCGGEKSDSVTEMIKEAVSKLERGNVEKINYRKNSPLKKEVRTVYEKMAVNQSKLVLAYKSDYEDIYTAKLCTMLLGGTPFSKLFANVREKMSLCYYCSAGYIDRKGTMIIDSGVESQNIEKAKTAIAEQLAAVANGDFTDEELYNTKLLLTGNFKSNYDNIYDMSGWYEAQNTRGTSYTPDQVTDIIMKITREQIIECAKSFKPDTVYAIESTGEASDNE